MNRNLRTLFGKRVRAIRNEKKWSQEEFADRATLHRTYVGSIERGERNISLDNIQKIAKAFDISISKLFEGM